MINARNHYWIIGDATTTVYQSATNIYVALDDSAYLKWIDFGNQPTNILNEAELWNVLQAYAPGHLPEWLFDGARFVQPAPGDYTPSQLVSYAAQKRWQAETGGIVVNGVKVATDDRSKQMIMGARIAAEANSAFTTPWVGTDGAIVTLNAA